MRKCLHKYELSQTSFVNNSHLKDNPHCSILFDNKTAMIKHPVIAQRHINAIHASPETPESMSRCHCYDTAYLPPAVCDRTLSCVKQCLIGNSSMSGIIASNRETVSFKSALLKIFNNQELL
jgi:hypothetical protein